MKDCRLQLSFRRFSFSEPITILLSVLIPEFGNLHIAVFHEKFSFKSNQPQRFFFLHNIIHLIPSLYRNIDFQRQKHMHFRRLPLKLQWGKAVKSGKSLREAFRRVISILKRKINHLFLIPDHIQRRQIEPSAAHILRHRIACHDVEAFLEINWRDPHLPRHIIFLLRIQQMFFQTRNYFSYAPKPFHALSPSSPDSAKTLPWPLPSAPWL